jgi:hypothetical protein
MAVTNIAVVDSIAVVYVCFATLQTFFNLFIPKILANSCNPNLN